MKLKSLGKCLGRGGVERFRSLLSGSKFYSLVNREPGPCPALKAATRAPELRVPVCVCGGGVGSPERDRLA